MPYIICVELDENGQQKESTGGLAERAYHRDELAANPNLRVDVEYYMANQVCPSSMSPGMLFLLCSMGRDVCCFHSLREAQKLCQTKKEPCMRQHEDCLTDG